jgi:hypothetical protein
MARTYGEDSYGSRKDLMMGNKGSIDGTYQSAVDIVRHTFMKPAKVVDWNLSIMAGGTNLGADVFFYLGKSAGGTGAVTAFGTADPLQGTGTHADASVLDASATATTFSAGDDLVFQAVGTIGHAMIISPHAEYLENYEQADS